MKWSFYEFGELVNEHKQDLMEMPMRNQGEPQQYDVGPTPYKATNAPDGYQGRNTRLNVHDTEEGQSLDRDARRASYAKWAAENPEKAKAMNDLNKAQRAERAAHNRETEQLGHRVKAVVGGRRVDTGEQLSAIDKSFPDDDQRPEARMARKIDEIIMNNAASFSKPMTVKEMVQKIMSVGLDGGLARATEQEIANGIRAIKDAVGERYLRKTEDGKWQITVPAVIQSSKTAGVDVESDHAIATGLAKTYPKEFEQGMQQWRSLYRKSQDPRSDEKLIKLTHKLNQLGDDIERGRHGMGQQAGEAIKDDLETVRKFLRKVASTQGGAIDFNSLFGQ